MTDQPQTETRRSPIERFFGGHPINVILKLAVMVVVGAMVYLASICLINAQSVGRLADFILTGLNRNGAR